MADTSIEFAAANCASDLSPVVATSCQVLRELARRHDRLELLNQRRGVRCAGPEEDIEVDGRAVQRDGVAVLPDRGDQPP
jgi:hypothetical protein